MELPSLVNLTRQMSQYQQNSCCQSHRHGSIGHQDGIMNIRYANSYMHVAAYGPDAGNPCHPSMGICWLESLMESSSISLFLLQDVCANIQIRQNKIVNLFIVNTISRPLKQQQFVE
jgi:hypothetical protein